MYIVPSLQAQSRKLFLLQRRIPVLAAAPD